MLRAAAVLQDGKYLLLLGLEETNLRLLQEGRPILVSVAAMVPPEVAESLLASKLEIAIYYGKDRAHLISQLRGFPMPEPEEQSG